MEPIIERATDEDAPAIHALMREVAAGVPDPSFYLVDDLDFVRDHIARRGFTLVARLGGELVGFFIIRFPGADPDNLGQELGLEGADLGRVAHMESAAIRRDAQARFLSRRLLLRAEAEMPGHIRWLLATAHPDNSASAVGLQREGYRIVTTTTKYGGWPRHVLAKDRGEAPPEG